MAVANFISVVGTALTTIGFLQANFPQPSVNYAQVRVAVGLDHQGLQDAGGEEPRTLGFNENNKKIGSVAGFEEDLPRVSVSSSDFQQWRPRIIQNGGFVDQTLKGTGKGGQVTTLQVDAAANGICIAYLSLTWSDSQKFGWLGDLGRACGYPWYVSKINIGPEGDGDENKPLYQPACTWIDSNYPQYPGGMKIRMKDFRLDGEKSKFKKTGFDKKKYCKAPIMEFYKDSKYTYASHAANTYEVPTYKRDDLIERPILPRNETTLIASRSTQHSARELCESETSRGPDFISHHEGLHCDMMTRELKPLCDGSNLEDCFAWEPQSRVFGKRDVAQVLDYGRFEEWD